MAVPGACDGIGKFKMICGRVCVGAAEEIVPVADSNEVSTRRDVGTHAWLSDSTEVDGVAIGGGDVGTAVAAVRGVLILPPLV